jgi:hypothetical protein
MKDLSCRVYKLLLVAYPSAFRREYGHQMQQVFRDCYRDEARRNQFAIAGYWMRTLLDLVLTATKEHTEHFRKDHTIMSSLRRDIVPLVSCTAIIVVAFTLLSYGRTHEVWSILAFGRVLDAIVTTGIIGNLVVFFARQDDEVAFAAYCLMDVRCRTCRAVDRYSRYRATDRSAVSVWTYCACVLPELLVLVRTTLGVAPLQSSTGKALTSKVSARALINLTARRNRPSLRFAE